MKNKELPKVIFVGGKGGVGKSTTSSSLAVALSSGENAKKVLLVSTDPAHNLSDIFDVEFKNSITKVDENLSVIEIDSALEAREYVQKVAKDMRGFVGASSYAQIDNYFAKISDSSSTLEAALFERLSTILTKEISSYDHIIIDTAPTGHTLRLFFMPKELRDWSKTLLSMQERGGMSEKVLGHLDGGDKNRFSDPDGFIRGRLIEKLDERYARYSAFSNLVKDSSKCGIVLVLNASKLAIAETQRAIQSLEQKELKPYAVVLNKVLPDSSNDDFLSSRISQEAQYVKQSDNEFGKYHYAKIPLFKEDITNKENLKIFGEKVLESII
ncbi:arsenite-transporting ATPase [Campylobacter pinnipediorum subsp. pinnipediorum]|uniref:ArsA family ATPase n=1 Tax=Campylobacter pinnipediorum TaxID=1965231 RepID=UPI0009952BED|nr:TRC40/GET3/ArsA family transport-energizing ATPase [Campylobacter pinnipediorum]AQW83955.1 arsenite-transporting ATPase [Campylobacter pinnipediorum subsp. pinnipediorum]